MINYKQSGGAIYICSQKKGFTLVEIVVDIAIVTLVATAVLSAYSAGFKSMELARAKLAAVALANEKMEEIRNLPYDELATVAGPIYPPGEILDNETVDRKGIQFNVHIVISYVDDPFDGDVLGSIPGKPQDLYPYDYKKVEITTSKIERSGYLARLSSNVSAKAAETPSNSGIIRLCIADETGVPVPEANITITNPDVTPPVNISAVTGNDGCIMVPNLPPDQQNNYHLTATKDGFSTDMTYPRTPQNPNALQPDVDVSLQQVTNQTLYIDRLSTMAIDFVNETGAPIPNISFHLEGSKEMYFNPSTFKYSSDLTADANGHIELTNMEYDDYKITIPGWIVVSTSPYQPVGLHANTTLPVKIVAAQNLNWPVIYNCEPRAAQSGETARLTVTGNNFADGLGIKLINGTNEIAGTNIDLTQDDTIDADFDLSGAEAGLWDILITNPGGETVRQEKGIEIQN